MTDKQENDATSAVSEDQASEEQHKHDDDHPDEERLNQTIEMNDVGPCKKHIKVKIDRADIDKRCDEEYGKLVFDAQIPGFRPGKAPRKVVVRRFQKDVLNQVKGQVILASLEQLAEDHDLAPLSAPNINPDSLVIPEEGDFVYEFDVEVRPEFDLPNYKGLKLKRPVKEFTDEDVEKEEHRILSRLGQMVPKPEGDAQVGDYVTVDMTTRFEGQVIGDAREITLRVDDRLAFKDGVAEGFSKKIAGVNPGDTRDIELTLAENVADQALRSKTAIATMEVKEVKQIRLPEMTEELLDNFGAQNAEQFRERVRALMEARLEYEQRKSARDQVIEQIAVASDWELPQDLLVRQARKSLARRVMEMRESGMSDEEIEARQRLLQQDVLKNTANLLKEHFVLQRIAEEEDIDVTDDEIDAEIDRIAEQSDESARRVRAQMEREDLIETLAAQLIERKTLDMILDSAEYEEVPLDEEESIGSVEEQAVPGELRDATAEEAAEESQTDAEKSSEQETAGN